MASPRSREPPLHDDRRHRTTPDLELALDDGPYCPSRWVRLKVLDFGDERDQFEEIVDAIAGERRDLGGDDIATEFLDHDVVLGQGCPDRIRVGSRQVHLVDGDDHWNSGCLGMIDGLGRLRHHAVVGCHHDDHDVGDVRPAGPQRGERLVTRCVDEGDRALVPLDPIGADVLRYPAGLAGHHIGVSNRVEELGLAVIDVPHDGDDGRARAKAGWIILEFDTEYARALLVDLLGVLDENVVSKRLPEILERISRKRPGRRGHLAHHHHLFHHITGALTDQTRKLGTGNALLDNERLAFGGENIHRRAIVAISRGRFFADRLVVRGVRRFGRVGPPRRLFLPRRTAEPEPPRPRPDPTRRFWPRNRARERAPARLWTRVRGLAPARRPAA